MCLKTNTMKEENGETKKIINEDALISKRAAEHSENGVLRDNAKHQKEGGLRILVAEDDKFLRNILSSKLKLEGFEVEEAIDGREALKKMSEFAPKLVLLDLMMPDTDGFEVLKRMHEKEEFSKIPVLVLTNLGQDEDVRRAKALGARECLVKAYFTPTEIVARVQKTLQEVYF